MTRGTRRGCPSLSCTSSTRAALSIVDSTLRRLRTIPGSSSRRSTSFVPKPGDGRRIEACERAPVALALVQDRRPRQPRLRPLEREHLEQVHVVVRGNAPLLVVVGEHELASFGRPLAARDARHRSVGSHAVRALLAVLVALVLRRRLRRRGRRRRAGRRRHDRGDGMRRGRRARGARARAGSGADGRARRVDDATR